MWYKGKEVNLREYVEDKKKEYVGKPEWHWEDEGLIYAIQDYESSVPYADWSDDDKEYLLHDLGLIELTALFEED